MSDQANKPGEILVIDDDAIMRELIGDWLEAAGYRVRKASSCRAARVPLSRRYTPSIISSGYEIMP